MPAPFTCRMTVTWCSTSFKWQAGIYATPSPGPFPAQGCSIGSYLMVNQRLNANQCIVSPHGQYLLYMAPDGNFYIYDLAHNTGTWGPGTYGHPGAYAMLQSDGNFVVYDANRVYGAAALTAPMPIGSIWKMTAESSFTSPHGIVEPQMGNSTEPL